MVLIQICFILWRELIFRFTRSNEWYSSITTAIARMGEIHILQRSMLAAAVRFATRNPWEYPSPTTHATYGHTSRGVRRLDKESTSDPASKRISMSPNMVDRGTSRSC
uniref:Uncharacterized protein n=1 Tax=Compsopogon caeruleus TaxID=31354 RepID=A0A7S1TA10_9RHOD|mmetsp:Transcript_1368/g.2819  ORF Transcript_1368/g.2819 Transcript_1368/m.2819 type:complete len:108 (+) Transcript_1368:1736-2059(+)